jgi:hypothetical protein
MGLGLVRFQIQLPTIPSVNDVTIELQPSQIFATNGAERQERNHQAVAELDRGKPLRWGLT